ncbi:MAG: hypothetical protein NZL95_03580 [Chitinophagales bacterium]|nr:hypothetical protein [Chitinophagales bacterium]MDW8427611.1 hypothetical protein [Chitinophagales bacterium]
MKKTLFLAFVLLLSFKISAQTEKASIVQYAPSVYIELFGPSALYAVNFDQRIAARRDGLGFRGGIGYINVDDFKMLVVPLGFNYLIGKENRYLELGLGATFMDASRGYLFFEPEDNFAGTLYFGFRRQPEDGGINFRFGVSPLFSGRNFFPFWGGIGFGYSW